MTRLAFMVAVLGLLTTSGPGTAAGAAKPVTHKVVIDGTRFEPDILTINVGDSVVWINNDPFPHTATSKAGKFDSGDIDAGTSWTFTPGAKGEFAYLCTLHPTMKAVLRVE